MSFPVFEKYKYEFLSKRNWACDQFYQEQQGKITFPDVFKEEFEKNIKKYTFDWFNKTIPALYNHDYPCYNLLELINRSEIYLMWRSMHRNVIHNEIPNYNFLKQLVPEIFAREPAIESFIKELPIDFNNIKNKLFRADCTKYNVGIKRLFEKPYYVTLGGNAAILTKIFPLKRGGYCNINCANCKLRKLKDELQGENVEYILELQEEIRKLKKTIKINKEAHINELKKIKELNKNTYKLGKKIIFDLQKSKKEIKKNKIDFEHKINEMNKYILIIKKYIKK